MASRAKRSSQFDKLMIVAHPDDELIFGGKLLLEKGWHVITITNGDNTTRSKEFRGLMKELGQSHHMLSHYDTMDDGEIDEPTTSYIRNFIANNKNKLKKIVTHNRRGEYGHAQHVGVHKMVTHIVNDLGLQDKLYYFRQGTKNSPKKVINRMYELMKKYYPSQYQVIDRLKLRNYIQKQDYRKVTK